MDLDKRMIKHKCDAKQRPHLSKFYTYMNEMGIENFEIQLVEDYPCESKEELRRREDEVIQEIGTLNEKKQEEHKQSMARNIQRIIGAK